MDDNQAFDLDGSGVIDASDVSQWLSLAATENGNAEPYKQGDANLDGEINRLDLNAVGVSWETNDNTWSTGDFNGDGFVDQQDLNYVGAAWLSSISTVEPAAAAVPEPVIDGTILLSLFIFSLRQRKPTTVSYTHLTLPTICSV